MNNKIYTSSLIYRYIWFASLLPAIYFGYLAYNNIDNHKTLIGSLFIAIIFLFIAFGSYCLFSVKYIIKEDVLLIENLFFSKKYNLANMVGFRLIKSPHFYVPSSFNIKFNDGKTLSISLTGNMLGELAIGIDEKYYKTLKERVAQALNNNKSILLKHPKPFKASIVFSIFVIPISLLFLGYSLVNKTDHYILVVIGLCFCLYELFKGFKIKNIGYEVKKEGIIVRTGKNQEQLNWSSISKIQYKEQNDGIKVIYKLYNNRQITIEPIFFQGIPGILEFIQKQSNKRTEIM